MSIQRRHFHPLRASLLALGLVCSIHLGCHGGPPGTDGPIALDLAGAPGDLSRPGDLSTATDLSSPDLLPVRDMGHDLGPSSDLAGGPVPDPPPASCNQRNPGVTAIQVVVQVDEYQGIIHGRNGDHEIVYGTVTDTIWVYDSKVVDTSNVQLALNVKSAKDMTGLPHEIPLSPGDSLEVEGEYIPAATANAHDKKGPAAVIHYTHMPCGFVTIAGTTYR